MTDRKDLDGGAIDIRKMIGKIPKPKGGWTPSDYKYLGPYNPLNKQLKYDPETGEGLSWYVKPKNKVDEIAAYHDICYDRGINKNECDDSKYQLFFNSFITFKFFWFRIGILFPKTNGKTVTC